MLLKLQCIQTSIEGVVEGDFKDSWPQIHPKMFPQSLPHLWILGAKVIGTQEQNEKLKTRFLKCPTITNKI